MLSDSEQQRLNEIESELRADDPILWRDLSNPRSFLTARRRRWLALLGAAAATVVAVAGLAFANVAVVVIAICAIGIAGGVWTWHPAVAHDGELPTNPPTAPDR